MKKRITNPSDFREIEFRFFVVIATTVENDVRTPFLYRIRVVPDLSVFVRLKRNENPKTSVIFGFTVFCITCDQWRISVNF